MDSPQHKQLQQIITVVPIGNESSYKHDYNKFMKTFMTLATADFKDWEEETKVVEEVKIDKVEDKIVM